MGGGLLSLVLIFLATQEWFGIESDRSISDEVNKYQLLDAQSLLVPFSNVTEKYAIIVLTTPEDCSVCLHGESAVWIQAIVSSGKPMCAIVSSVSLRVAKLFHRTYIPSIPVFFDTTKQLNNALGIDETPAVIVIDDQKNLVFLGSPLKNQKAFFQALQ